MELNTKPTEDGRWIAAWVDFGEDFYVIGPTPQHSMNELVKDIVEWAGKQRAEQLRLMGHVNTDDSV
jgi:hypothetical protein